MIGAAGAAVGAAVTRRAMICATRGLPKEMMIGGRGWRRGAARAGGLSSERATGGAAAVGSAAATPTELQLVNAAPPIPLGTRNFLNLSAPRESCARVVSTCNARKPTRAPFDPPAKLWWEEFLASRLAAALATMSAMATMRRRRGKVEMREVW